MPRFPQIVFVVAFLALSWLGMMAVHELGHVVGALATGGSVTRVVLHPLAISRTDVSPNPHPGVVVWLGPIVGSLLPLAVFLLMPRRFVRLRGMAQFFAGFCLVANGAYVSGGAFDGVGDAGEMLRTGTPLWVMVAFGVVAVPLGLALWHRLDSVKHFAENSAIVTREMTVFVLVALAVLIVVEIALFPR